MFEELGLAQELARPLSGETRSPVALALQTLRQL
jgi:hypothetical protein